MAKPTLQLVLDTSRSHLGDDAQQGGQVFTDTLLLPFLGLAYRELFRSMQMTQNPFIRQEAYYLLPANTAVLDPLTAGVTDMAQLEWVEERAAGFAAAITGAVAATPTPSQMQITAPNHGFAPAAEVLISGLQGFNLYNNPNSSIWTISVIDANNFTLNGCTCTGTAIITPYAFAYQGIDEFVTMNPYDRIENIPVTPGPTLNAYAWEGNVLKFVPASSARQLRIVYTLSGAMPTNNSAIIGLDDSLDYLATRTAGLAMLSRGALQKAQVLNDLAIGPEGVADGSGGMLRELLAAQIRGMQREQFRRPPFRRRRNIPDAIYY